MAGQRGGCRNEGGDEDDHQQGGLGEESHHHLAARPERAEGGADVHRGERQEDPCRGEQTHERDGIGRDREWQSRAHRGNDAGGDHHRAEHDVGRHAKERGRTFGDHGVLVKELANAAVGQPEARCATVLQPRATLVDPAEKERCRGERCDQLEHLGEDLDRLHTHERQQHDERHEAVEQVGGDASLLQPREGIRNALDEGAERQVQPLPDPVP